MGEPLDDWTTWSIVELREIVQQLTFWNMTPYRPPGSLSTTNDLLRPLVILTQQLAFRGHAVLWCLILVECPKMCRITCAINRPGVSSNEASKCPVKM